MTGNAALVHGQALGRLGSQANGPLSLSLSLHLLLLLVLRHTMLGNPMSY